MKKIPAVHTSSRQYRGRLYIVLPLATLLILFAALVHPFLSVTHRVDADVLVVEGWIPNYMFPAAAREFREHPYTRVLVSGLQNEPGDTSGIAPDFARAAIELKKAGVPENQIVECPAPFATWLRTSKTAQAVRAQADRLIPPPRSVNIVTAGPHARETWVAYQHAFGKKIPVGIVSIPKADYPANRWWLSKRGLIWVPKDFIAWLKEVIFGLRL